MKNVLSIYNGYYYEDLKKTIETTINFSDLDNNSILVTGATGLIGSFIVDTVMYANQMKSCNVKVYALGRSYARLKNRFQIYENNELLSIIEQDISENFAFDFKADYVIHAAGNAYPAAFKNDPVGTVLSNIVGTKNLLNYARSCGSKKFLFISSGEVYGQVNKESLEEDDEGYVDILSVRSCYPMSKRAAENLCVAFAEQYGMHTVIARLCHIYGPNTTEQDNRASAQFITDALNNKDIVLKSLGNQIRSYCYIGDCASAILTILLSGMNCEAYNVSDNHTRVSIAELANIIAKTAGVTVKMLIERDGKHDTPIERAVLNSSKLENLGWHSRYTINEGIEHTLNILKNKKV